MIVVVRALYYAHAFRIEHQRQASYKFSTGIVKALFVTVKLPLREAQRVNMSGYLALGGLLMAEYCRASTG